MESQNNTIYVKIGNEEECINTMIDTYGGAIENDRYHVDNEKARINVSILPFLKDVVFYVAEMYFEEELTIREAVEEPAQLIVQIIRSGEIIHREGERSTHWKTLQHGATMYSTKHAFDFKVPAKKKIQVLSIRVPVDFWLLTVGYLLPDLSEIAVSEKPWIIYEDNTHRMEADLDRLFEHNKSTDLFSISYSTARCIDIATHFMVKLSNRLGKNTEIDMLDVDTQILFQIKIELDNNIKTPPSMEELAQKYMMSVSKLSNNFKKAFGLRPKQYIVHYRLIEAKRVIEYTNDPLYKIAEDLGFSDVAHLSSRFKKEFGKSPKTIREEAQQQPYYRNTSNVSTIQQ